MHAMIRPDSRQPLHWKPALHHHPWALRRYAAGETPATLRNCREK
jgi:hypothetical protein